MFSSDSMGPTSLVLWINWGVDANTFKMPIVYEECLHSTFTLSKVNSIMGSNCHISKLKIYDLTLVSTCQIQMIPHTTIQNLWFCSSCRSVPPTTKYHWKNMVQKKEHILNHLWFCSITNFSIVIWNRNKKNQNQENKTWVLAYSVSSSTTV